MSRRAMEKHSDRETDLSALLAALLRHTVLFAIDTASL